MTALLTTSDPSPGGHRGSVRRPFPSAQPAGSARRPQHPGRRQRSSSCPLSPRSSSGRSRARLTFDSPALGQGSSSPPPPPGTLPCPTPAHLGPSPGEPPYLPVPHFGKYGHRVSALLATGPRRAWAVGLDWARSLESLRQILLFLPAHQHLTWSERAGLLPADACALAQEFTPPAPVPAPRGAELGSDGFIAAAISSSTPAFPNSPNPLSRSVSDLGTEVACLPGCARRAASVRGCLHTQALGASTQSSHGSPPP